MPRDVRREAAQLILSGQKLSRKKWQGVMETRLELIKQLVEQYPTPTLEKALRGDSNTGGSLNCIWSSSCNRILPQAIRLNTHVILGGETEAEEEEDKAHQTRWGMARTGRWFRLRADFKQVDCGRRQALAGLQVYEYPFTRIVEQYGPQEVAELLGDFIYACHHRHSGLFKAVEILNAQEELLGAMQS